MLRRTGPRDCAPGWWTLESDRTAGTTCRLQAESSYSAPFRRSDWFEADALSDRLAAEDVRDSAHPAPQFWKRRSLWTADHRTSNPRQPLRDSPPGDAISWCLEG